MTYDYSNYSLIERIHLELTKVKIDIPKYKEEIKRCKETRANIPNYYDYTTDLDHSEQHNILDDRKYYYRARHYLGIGILRPTPSFKISLQDLSPELIKELSVLDPEERGYVLKQSVGRIFEDINQDVYHNSLSSILKVKPIDGRDYDYVYTIKDYKNDDDNSICDQIQKDQLIKRILDEKKDNNITTNIEYIKLQLDKQVPDRDYLEYIVNCIKKTVKCEDVLIKQILYTGFSAYIEDDPINLGVLAPTSEGKSYSIIETLKYFPDEDILYIGQMSPKVLVRQKGILIDKDTGEPIADKIRELETKLRELEKKKNMTPKEDQNIREEIKDQINIINKDIKRTYENSKTLIDLRCKILVFLEPPNHYLWELLKPILSHDKKEIEYPFVDKDPTSNAKARDVVVRGWPACIFCSAKDQSRWEIWPEIKSRILVTSPNMIQQKYRESNELISRTKGLPNLIQQQLIISDREIEIAKSCVIIIKDTINQSKVQSHTGKISLWIPYYELLRQLLPANKGTDVRFTKRLFALLNIVPIVNNSSRMVMLMEGERSIIANIEDLKEVLTISHNIDGIPKHKVDFFNNIFLDLFKQKTQPDFKIYKDGKEISEEIIAVTTRQLCDHFKKKTNDAINADNLKKTYLDPLINEELIEYTRSEINGKEYIYYPLVTEHLSLLSNLDTIDKNLQEKQSIYEKIIIKLTEGWFFHEIMRLICCRIDQTGIDFFDYIRNKIMILSANRISKEYEDTKARNGQLESGDKGVLGELLSFECINQDTNFSKTLNLFDNKISPILVYFAKRNLFLSNLARIDKEDKIREVNNYTKEEIHQNNNYL